MENWKDYVSYQPAQEGSDTAMVFYLYCEKDESDECICCSIEKKAIDKSQSIYDYITIGDAVEKTIAEFPKLVVENLDREKVRVAENTRRGFAKTNFGSAWFYNGTTIVDKPIIVVDFDGSYAIVKHPKFNDYGFNIAEKL